MFRETNVVEEEKEKPGLIKTIRCFRYFRLDAVGVKSSKTLER